MLPAHLQSAESRRRRTKNPVSSPTPSAPPLGVTGVLCQTHSIPRPGRGNLQVSVYRPRHLHYNPFVKVPPPLVCVAGGPLLPATYLLPLVHTIPDRAVVWYDALGCGMSTPSPHLDASEYTRPSEMVQDLECVLAHVQSLMMQGSNRTGAGASKKAAASAKGNDDDKTFHYCLYGHSFGGWMVHKHLLQHEAATLSSKQWHCCAAILASTPWTVASARQSAQTLREQLKAATTTDDNDTEDQYDSDEYDDETSNGTRKESFFQVHECRRQPIPLVLEQALARAPSVARRYVQEAQEDTTVSLDDEPSGLAGIQQDEEQPSKLTTPTLLLRGEYDFVADADLQQWQDLFLHSTTKTLPDCAHYGMHDDEVLYGTTCGDFLRQYDPA